MDRVAAKTAPMPASPSETASRRAAAPPVGRAVGRLQDIQVDAASGLHIGTAVIGTQKLRVGIRPRPPASEPAIAARRCCCSTALAPTWS